MKEAFLTKTFRGASMALINQANAIIAEYQRDGYTLTLRQLYYQFVRRDAFPATWADKVTGSTNNEGSYHKLGSLISDARMAGLIDWRAIEDRTRNLRAVTTFEDTRELAANLPYWHKLDKWATQPAYIEVWVEKEALLSVVGRAAGALEVPYFACKGYVSSSEVYDAAKRFAAKRDAGKEITLLHLGDHDPSGIDMTRDNTERLELMLEYEGINVNRLALNYDQVLAYNPPPNPAKNTDTRFAEYRARFGVDCWELDALEPAVIADLITTNVLALRDESAWRDALADEATQKERLRKIARSWYDVDVAFGS